MNHLVSICIPAYQQPALLERCFKSIISQTYKEVEVLISDDTPDDSVKIIVDKFAKDLNISYWQNLKPLGSPSNWNAAIEKAKGPYVILLHHDDYFASEHSLARFITPFEGNSSVEFVFGRNPSIETLSRGKPFSHKFFQQYYQDPELLLAGNYIGAPSNVMLRVSAIEPYHKIYKWIVDIDFYIRLFKTKKRFFYVDENLVNIGIHEGQVTNDCVNNDQVLLFENISYAMENNLTVRSLKLYDFYWRLIRNAGIKSPEQLCQVGLTKNSIPAFIRRIISLQRLIPGRFLQMGIFSKALMTVGFFKYRQS
jgi:glycosyltransferase involved in cell wall biosynthesis